LIFISMRCTTKHCLAILCSFFILLPHFVSSQNSEEDVKKQAQKFFDAGDYTSALPLYSQLLSFYAKDANYNYRYGVCALEAGNDREKPISFLEFASRNKEVNNNVFFYLGKAYHLNYRFSSALNAYNTYKIKAPKAEQDKFLVDRQLAMCRNGMELLKNISDLVVMDKKELALTDYFRAYDLSSIGLKLLVKPDDFKTDLDKKKNEESVVVLNPNKSEIYFSSYGNNDKNGKDIYKVKRMDNGDWTNPIRLENNINSEFDEDFPFVSNDGTTLYFCSKGHNSMGGYDVFKSVYNPESGTWGAPENMDFAINTPDDDMLYIADDVNKVAYFSSRRTSGQGNVNVYKIKVGPRPPSIALISGVFSSGDENTHPEATITVRDSRTKVIIGVYKTDIRTGNYSIPLPSSGTYIFNVESEISAMKTETVVVPEKKDLGTLQQKINLTSDKLIVQNIFEDAEINEANLMALLKAKANLDVNYVPEPIAVVEEPKVSNLTNQELVNIAYQDAKDTKAEADQMRSKSDQAYAVSKSKMDVSKSKLNTADILERSAQSISSSQERGAEMDKVNQLRREAKTNTLLASAIYSIAQNLEEDANAKQAEADQSLNYAKELDNAIQINSAESIAKLTAQKNKIQESAASKNLAEVSINELNEKSEVKQLDADAAQSRSKIVLTEILDIDLKSETLAKDKSGASNTQVAEIDKQLEDLKLQKEAKQKQLAQNYSTANQLQQEADDLKSQAEFIASALNDLKTENKNLVVPNAQEKITLGNELAIDLGRANTLASEDIKPVLQVNNSDIDDSASDAFITTDVGKTPVTAENFDAKMAQVNKISDPVKREEQRNIVRKQMNSNWENDIADLKTQQSNSKDKNERAAMQSRITELENLKAMNSPTPEISLTTADQVKKDSLNKAMADSKESQLASTSTSSKAETSPKAEAAVAETPVSKLNEVPAATPSEAVNVSKLESDFDLQVAALEQISSVSEKEQASQKLVDNWKKVSDYEIAKTQIQLSNAKNSEDIATLNETLNELQELKSKVIASGPIAEVPATTQTSEGVATNPLAVNNESKTLSSPITNSPVSAVETPSGVALESNEAGGAALENTFTTDAAKAQARKVDRLNSEAEKLKIVEDSLTRILVSTNDTAQKRYVENQLATAQKEIFVKRIDALRAYSVANNVEFNGNTEQLKRAEQSKGNLDTDEISRAEMLVSEAAYYYNEASIKNDINKSVTDASVKEAELIKIVELEKTAIEKQRRALTTYGVQTTATLASTTENSKSEISGPSVALAPSSNAVNDESNIEKTSDSKPNQIAETKSTEANREEPKTTPVESTKSLTEQNAEVNQTVATLGVQETTVENANVPMEIITERDRAFVYPTDTMRVTTRLKAVQYDSIAKSSYYNYYNNLLVTATENKQQADYYLARSEQLKIESRADSLKSEEIIMQASRATDTLQMQELISKAAEATYSATVKKQAADSSFGASRRLNMAYLDNKLNASRYVSRLDETDRKKLVAVMNYKRPAEPTTVLASASSVNQNKVEAKVEPIVAAIPPSEQPEKTATPETQSPAIENQNTIGIASNNDANQNKVETAVEQNVVETPPAGQPLNTVDTTESQSPDIENQNAIGIASNNDANQNKVETTVEQNVVEAPPAGRVENVLDTIASQSPVLAILTEVEATPVAEKVTAVETQTQKDSSLNQSQVDRKEVNETSRQLNNQDLQVAENTSLVVASPALSKVVNERNELVRDAVFTKVDRAVYNKNNPIPINTQQPSGIIFKVQIGAFRNPIPQDLFKGFDPISGETSSTGITRYTAGYFKNFEAANSAKREINVIGYKDAFVVAFCNGKRISIPEATAMIRDGRTCAGEALAETKVNVNNSTALEPSIQKVEVKKEEKKPAPTISFAENAIRNEQFRAEEKKQIESETKPTAVSIDSVPSQVNPSAEIEAPTGQVTAENKEIKTEPKPTVVPIETTPGQVTPTAIIEQPSGPVAPSVSFEEVKGLVYTIQVGVYSKQILANQLFNIQPLYFERTPSGLYRYTSGIFDNLEIATQAKESIVGIGVKDAFITSYFNGNRITVEEARRLEQEQGKGVFSNAANLNKMPETNANAKITGLSAAVPTVRKEKVDVPSTQAGKGANAIALPLEGLKNQINNAIIFKVQIGVFRSEIPLEIASIFLKLSSRGIDHYQTSDSLNIYTIGNFRDIKSANSLKDEVIQEGLPDAFVVAFKGGDKMKLEDAIKEVNQK
jgi:hypothetical protein